MSRRTTPPRVERNSTSIYRGRTFINMADSRRSENWIYGGVAPART